MSQFPKTISFFLGENENGDEKLANKFSNNI